MPMIDYEQPLPADVDAAYRAAAGRLPRARQRPDARRRPIVRRQMLWMERAWPEALRPGARLSSHTPQYWAWRLSGVMASEVTSAAAQSHLWCGRDRPPGGHRRAPRLGAAPAAHARRPGRRSARSARRSRRATGLDPATRGALRHPRFLAPTSTATRRPAWRDFTVVSTGTWIVALTDRHRRRRLRRRAARAHAATPTSRARRCPACSPWAAASSRRSRAARRARPTARCARADRRRAAPWRCRSSATTTACSPARARRGRIVGPLAERSPRALHAGGPLCRAADGRGPRRAAAAGTVVLDGSFVREPLYGALVAGAAARARVLVNRDSVGTAAGAALLASHETRAAPRAARTSTRPKPLATCRTSPTTAPRWRDRFDTWRPMT